MRGILTRIDGGVALRTNSVEGEFEQLPTVGEKFIILGEPLTEGTDVRVVSTSPVVAVDDPTQQTMFIKTENSLYKLEIIQ